MVLPELILLPLTFLSGVGTEKISEARLKSCSYDHVI